MKICPQLFIIFGHMLTVATTVSAVILDDVINYLERIGVGPDTAAKTVLPEARLTTIEIIARYGFPHETHTVTTSDGYIIELHRIPNNSTFVGGTKLPVILQHGVQCSSGAWVVNGLQDSLAFVLAREGFDVWLTNVRGNQYARKHTSISPESEDFWKFNIDHFALTDLPTIIDYVLSATGHPQINYIGHSMGSAMILGLLSDKPQYNHKVRLVVLQAPVFFERYIRSPLRLVYVYLKEIKTLWNQLKGTDELLRSSIWQKHLIQRLCNSYPGVILCEIFVYMVFGYDEVLSNRNRMHVFLSHCPSGTSFLVIEHFAQIFRDARFRHFNYGPKQNQRVYNKKTPPEYNLSNVIAPTAIFWSYMDLLTDREDIYQLAQRLPNLQFLEKVPFGLFAHHDFQFGLHATFHHNQKLLQILLSFNETKLQRTFPGSLNVDTCGLNDWPFVTSNKL